MKNIFEKETHLSILKRMEKLAPDSKAVWGKMNAAQMLAHCCVTYEMIYENNYPKATGFKKLLLKTFVKPIVVNEKPYKTNSRTAPEFIVSSEKDFETEKTRLLAYITKTYEKGADYFENKESHSFGKLTLTEWNNMFYKHLDHHFKQFSV